MTITVDIASFKPPPIPRGFKPPPGAPTPGGYDLEARAKRYTQIPDRYASPEQLGLKYTVKPGSQEYEIKLE